MTELPNIDAIQDPKELWELYRRFTNMKRKDTEALIGRFPGYTRAIRDVGHYCANKATAVSCRTKGKIQTALTYEAICDRIYDSLPESCRW